MEVEIVVALARDESEPVAAVLQLQVCVALGGIAIQMFSFMLNILTHIVEVRERLLEGNIDIVDLLDQLRRL